MRKHIFTLGLLLSSFCIMPTMAEYSNFVPVIEAANVWTKAQMVTDSDHAILHCTSCCGTEVNSRVRPTIPMLSNGKVDGFVTNDKTGVTCWLPNGTYYMRDPRDGYGDKPLMKFSMNNCLRESEKEKYPVCIENQTYTITASGRCVAECNRDGGIYDIGIDVCVNSTWNGYSYGHTDGTSTNSPELFVWNVVFHNSTLFQHDFIIHGIAACSDDSTNTTTLQQGDKKGTNCFCRMIWVSQSTLNNTSVNKNTYWEKVESYNNVDACASSCASKCGETVRTNPTMRKTMYANYAL